MTSLAQYLQPFDWATVDSRLYDWVTRVLPGVEAIWADQNIPQPSYPYVHMKRAALVRPGGKDEIRTSTDLGQSPGEEIEILATDQAEFTFNATANVDDSSGACDPAKNAMALLGKLQASLGLPTVQASLRAAKLAVIEPMGINDISLELNGQILNRASWDVRFRLVSEMTERTGYIEKVEVKAPALGIDQIFDAGA